jgi:hypothetical protein
MPGRRLPIEIVAATIDSSIGDGSVYLARQIIEDLEAEGWFIDAGDPLCAECGLERHAADAAGWAVRHRAAGEDPTLPPTLPPGVRPTTLGGM